jgi:two-component system, OmpR family, response regulator
MNDPKLIFVVDDDPFINMLVARQFSSEGYVVETFEFGEDCIEALHKNPDLIILDYFFISNGKEVMNGIEILNSIKKLLPKVPVIILSGQEKGEIVLELARNGIDDYVIKDNDLIENLKIALEELLKRK